MALTRDEIHNWHVAINRATDDLGLRPGADGEGGWPSFMYEAKDAYQEVPRLALLFRREREGQLPVVHRQCSRSPEETIPGGNFLSCCLGVKCGECKYLLALDKAEVAPEARDEMKAWTCAAHILMQGGDQMNEGYILTTDDRMYWDNVYAGLARSAEAEEDGVDG